MLKKIFIVVTVKRELTMTEKYIKASECEKYFYEHLDDLHMAGAMNAIDEMPNEDVVPVVRCKNCKYVDNGYIGHLNCRFFNSMPVSGMDYCKWGEQKEATSEKEVPVKRGHWIDNKHTDTAICSECKGVFTDETNYCPKCGARMNKIE